MSTNSFSPIWPPPSRPMPDSKNQTLLCIFSYITCIYDNIIKIYGFLL